MLSLLVLGTLGLSVACLAAERRRRQGRGRRAQERPPDGGEPGPPPSSEEKAARGAENRELAEALAALLRVPLLRLLPRDELPLLVAAFTPCTFAAGELVVSSLDVGELFLVRSGRAAAILGTHDDGVGRRVLELGEGDYFGGGLLRQEAASQPLAVVAETELTVLQMPGRSFARLGLDQRLWFARREVAWADEAAPQGRVPLCCHNGAQELLAHLRQLAMLAPLLTEEVRRLALVLVEQRLVEGDPLIEEGRPVDALHILREGRVAVAVLEGAEEAAPHDESAAVELIGGLEFFHGGRPCTATVRVASKSAAVLSLSRAAFAGLPPGVRGVLEHWHVCEQRNGRGGAGDPFRKRIRQCDLVPVGLLGSGGFARVDLVEHSPSGATFAAKCWGKGSIVKHGTAENVRQEKLTLMLTDSPFIVKLWETYNGAACLYFLLEAALGGDLHAVYGRHGLHGSEQHARFYAAGAALALAHLHTRLIVYRNLKPENLLLDAGGRLKVTHFDLAKFVVTKTFTTCGSPDRAAPEMIAAAGYAEGVDWWTLGILVFELMSGHAPFEATSPMESYTAAVQGAGSVHFPPKVQGAVGDFVRALLLKDPARRLPMRPGGVVNIRRHAWLEEFDWDACQSQQLQPPHLPDVAGPKDLSNFDADPARCPQQLSYDADASGCWDADFATA